jgi:hypothetical protein
MGKSQSESSIARTIECQDWRREILRSAQNDKSSAKGFAEGKRTMPGPGINALPYVLAPKGEDWLRVKRAA